ncbi:hypothetical protein BDZ45DRAFT_692610 [Acephala macrosclerotiorum]|nr:hypothetical protein BDZ45DRAFT_692610 [Acephala macrosclerotiorum]
MNREYSLPFDSREGWIDLPGHPVKFRWQYSVPNHAGLKAFVERMCARTAERHGHLNVTIRSCIHGSTRRGGRNGTIAKDYPHITCDFGHPHKETAHIYVGPIPPKPTAPDFDKMDFWKYPDKSADVEWFEVRDSGFVWPDGEEFPRARL